MRQSTLNPTLASLAPARLRALLVGKQGGKNVYVSM